MKKARYDPLQVALRPEAGGGGHPMAVIRLKIGISEQTFYRWKQIDQQDSH